MKLKHIEIVLTLIWAVCLFFMSVSVALALIETRHKLSKAQQEQDMCSVLLNKATQIMTKRQQWKFKAVIETATHKQEAM